MTRHLQDGLLIAIEGIDGAGKTTQAAMLAQAFAAAGFSVVQTKEPTSSPWGQKIRESARTARLSAAEELDLFVLDRTAHVANLIRPALAAGSVVIVDRYLYSTAAYQGARGMDPAELLRLNLDFAPAPDLLVVLDIDASAGLARVSGRGDVPDLFEQEDLLARSRSIFKSFLFDYALHLDARAPAEVLAAIIRERLYQGPMRMKLPVEEHVMLPGFERAPDPRASRAVEALAADERLTPAQRVAEIIQVVTAAEPRDGAVLWPGRSVG